MGNQVTSLSQGKRQGGILGAKVDTHLHRSAALKLLAEMFARDEERLKRFEREARLLTSLNHPNVASIHDLEEVDDRRFLVPVCF